MRFPPIIQLHVSPIQLDSQGFVRGFAAPDIVIFQQESEAAADVLSINGGITAETA